ncbi:hypothetical protein [Streptomyces caniscabiei]|uniref:hypothetical protein n=1 Tax=Streptomyces caniscabiei TaxID=2746961 RepID=UPI0029C0CA7D|nr:hypothetical protein [Streptomyces caniscabiei]
MVTAFTAALADPAPVARTGVAELHTRGETSEQGAGSGVASALHGVTASSPHRTPPSAASGNVRPVDDGA